MITFVAGEMISRSNSKYLTHEFILSEYSIRSRLTIRDFNPADIGIYKCTCKNDMNTGDRVEGMVFLALEKGITNSQGGGDNKQTDRRLIDTLRPCTHELMKDRLSAQILAYLLHTDP